MEAGDSRDCGKCRSAQLSLVPAKPVRKYSAHSAMNLEEARSAVILALGRMNALYQQPVFDEWVLAKLGSEQGAILCYQGPRADTYKRQFAADNVPLAAELGQNRMNPGDFVFAPDAGGTRFDACIRLGPSSYLFCNHTTRSMAEIRQSPRWLSAQKPFVDLAARFLADPLR